MTEAYHYGEQVPDTPVLTWVYIRRGQLRDEGAQCSQNSDQARLSGEAIAAKHFTVKAAEAEAALVKLTDAEDAIAAAEQSGNLYGYLGEVSDELEVLETELLTTRLAVEILGERVPQDASYENHLANTRMRAERSILYELHHVLASTIELQSLDDC